MWREFFQLLPTSFWKFEYSCWPWFDFVWLRMLLVECFRWFLMFLQHTSEACKWKNNHINIMNIWVLKKLFGWPNNWWFKRKDKVWMLRFRLIYLAHAKVEWNSIENLISLIFKLTQHVSHNFMTDIINSVPWMELKLRFSLIRKIKYWNQAEPLRWYLRDKGISW